MTHEKRESQWSSPERQEDLKYQERMKEYFAPDSARPTNRNDANGGRMRHPLKEDTTVIDPVEPERDQDTPPRGYDLQGGYAGGRERAVQGKAVRESVRDPEGLDLRRILLFALAALAVVVFLVFVWWLLFGRGGGDTGQEPQKTPAVSENAPEPTDTNLTFEAQDGKGDAYSVRMGDYEWEGTEGMNGDVEEVVLEGRTAAHFTTAVRLADGEITTGVFGRAEPERPLWHVTFQRTTTDGQQSTTGTYQVIDKKRVILEGAYTDRIVEDNPGKEPDVVVREYVEGDPSKGGEDVERFRAKFRAAEGVEIPWLPGNPIAEGGSEGGQQE